MSISESVLEQDEVYPLVITTSISPPIESYSVDEAVKLSFLHAPSSISIEGTEYIVHVNTSDTIEEVLEDVNYMIISIGMDD